MKKPPKNLFKGYTLLLISTLIWGVATPVIKYTLNYIPPFTFLFLRFLIATIIFFPYTVYEIQKVKIDRRDYLNFFLLGVFSQTSLALLFVGLDYTTAIDQTVIGILGSILLIVTGNYFYKEKISKRVKIGLVISTIGTILVVLEPILSGHHGLKITERILGNGLSLIYNVSWVIFIVWSRMSMGDRSKLLKKDFSFIHIKPMHKIYSPTLITSISVLVGMITIAPLSLLETLGFIGSNQNFNLTSPNGIIGLLYMSVFSTVIAYTTHQKSIKYVKVSDAAFFGYLSPIFTLPVAYLLLGETPNIFVIIGAILILSGVFIAEKSDESS